MRHRLIASGALIAALMAATVTTTVGQTPRAVLSHRGAVYTLAFSPASTELASGVEDGTLLEWSVADETSVELILSPTDAVQSIAYSPSGNEIAVAESGGEFGFVSLPSAAFRGPYAATTDALAWTGFMSGGLTLMVVAHDGYMATLQVSDGALIRGFSHPTLLHAGAISPNGLIGASGGDDGIVRLWDLTTGAEVSPLPMDHGAVIWSLAFSPDGTMLASGGVDNVVRLWDPATGGTLGSYISHAGNIRSLAFSPDNATVASASDDGTVKLWDVASGIATTTLADHTGSVRAVAYSPDGSLLASGGEDSSVRIYDVGPAASITITAPAASEEFPAGTTSTPLTVTVSDHPAPGHWHWQLDTPFPATGTATGTPVTAGTLTDTITGLVGGTSYTVYVALVVDETHALVDSTTNPDSRANVAFSVADGGASTVTVTPQDRQGRESGTVTIPIDVTDLTGLGVTAVALELTYDAALLTPVTTGTDTTAVALGAVYADPGAWTLDQNTPTPGQLNIALATGFADPAVGAGTLVSVVFDVAAGATVGATSPLTLTKALFNEGVVLTTTVVGTFSVLTRVYGDVTGNGEPTPFDASWILEYVVNYLLVPPVIVEFPIEETAPTWATDPVSAELALEVADVDGDLEITALDAGLILEYEVQLITVFPVETAPASPATDAVALANPLRASDAYLRPGGRFTVSLDASAMRSLQAGELVLGFDSSMLTPVDVAWTGASAVPGGQRPLIAQRAREGQLAIAFASARPIGGSDATLEVTFEAARNVVQPRESEIRAFHLRLNASRIATDFVFPFRVEPFQTRLMANYPNPFNPETWIPFELAADSDVTLRIYGLDGKIVRTLELGYRPMGEYRARESAAYWDGRNEIGERVASGLYVYELQAGDQRAVRRMVISK